MTKSDYNFKYGKDGDDKDSGEIEIGKIA